MIEDLAGKNARIFLGLSPWGESYVSGQVVAIDETWIRIRGKKHDEIVPISQIKRISLRD